MSVCLSAYNLGTDSAIVSRFSGRPRDSLRCKKVGAKVRVRSQKNGIFRISRHPVARRQVMGPGPPLWRRRCRPGPDSLTVCAAV